MVDFRLETPNGLILEPWRARGEPEMLFSLTENVAYYRIVLPAELIRARYDHSGTWHALLTIGRPRTRPPVDEPAGGPGPAQPVRDVAAMNTGLSPSVLARLVDREGPGVLRRIPPRTGSGATIVAPGAAAAAAEGPLTHVPSTRARALPYSLLVHAYSDLSLRARVEQGGYELGASASIIARVAESGLPPAAGAYVWAEIAGPSGSTTPLELAERAPGEFAGDFTMPESGVYSVRVRASGHSREGHPWQREQTLTAAVWRGGNRDADPANSGGGPVVRWLDEERERWCQLLHCVTGEHVLIPELERRLRESGIDLESLRRCLKLYCSSRAGEDE